MPLTPSHLRRRLRRGASWSRVLAGTCLLRASGAVRRAADRLMSSAPATVGHARPDPVSAACSVLAVIEPLPPPPPFTDDPAKDVHNLILYQTALAEHAWRHEQRRALGTFLSSVVP